MADGTTHKAFPFFPSSPHQTSFFPVPMHSAQDSWAILHSKNMCIPIHGIHRQSMGNPAECIVHRNHSRIPAWHIACSVFAVPFPSIKYHSFFSVDSMVFLRSCNGFPENSNSFIARSSTDKLFLMFFYHFSFLLLSIKCRHFTPFAYIGNIF